MLILLSAAFFQCPGVIAQANDSSQTEAGSEAVYRQEDMVSLRAVPDSIMNRLRNSRIYAYANDPEYWKQEAPAESWVEKAGRLSWVRALVYTLLGALLLYVLYRLIVDNKLYLFYSSGASRKTKVAEADAINEEGLDEKIAAFTASGDYRAAIRLMYLKALKLMNDKGWIRLSAGSTNHDYLDAVKQHPAAESFRFITRNYEYVWYGEFELNKRGFEALQGRFEQFYKTVR